MKMRLATCILLGLAGCATNRYDTVTAQLPAELGRGMATDSAKQLQALYPPGQTKFNIGQPVPQADVFGTALVKAIRENGYAVQEFSPKQPVEASGGLNLRYTVDKPETSLFEGLYRVRLSVGKSVLTRAYTASNKTANPAGAWAFME
jgi:type IV secretion system protein TrbH